MYWYIRGALQRGWIIYVGFPILGSHIAAVALLV